MQPLARSKGLEFQIHPSAAQLPAVLADETRVKQILFNLISNAIKFTTAGSVTLTVSGRDRSDGTLEMVFEIRDTGIGMDAKALSQLFQRFYQVDDGSTRRFGGTGLGLEISQSLASMMQGEITVASTVGEGSTFTLTLCLPIQGDPVSPAVAVIPVAPESTRSDAPRRSADAIGPHVLVVEDHPVNQKLVGVLLGRMGCQVEFCENGQLAVDRVQQQRFDMILMDVNMPVMDGLTATRQIRSLAGPVAQTPIVIFTADVMNEAQAQAMAAGADDFITKPVNVEHLRSIVQKYSAGMVAV
jgi:CheY-like chemotaxis protein